MRKFLLVMVGVQQNGVFASIVATNETLLKGQHIIACYLVATPFYAQGLSIFCLRRCNTLSRCQKMSRAQLCGTAL